MTNIDAGRQRIRRLPDKPIVGETYPNAGGFYKVDRYDAERDLAWVHRPKDGWKCCAHGPALYDVPVGVSSCSGITAPGASSVPTIAAKGGECYDLQDWALILAIGSIILNVLAEIIKHW